MNEDESNAARGGEGETGSENYDFEIINRDLVTITLEFPISLGFPGCSKLEKLVRCRGRV